jgi:hypothetical protein
VRAQVVVAKLPEIASSGSALNIWMERDQKAALHAGGAGAGGPGAQGHMGLLPTADAPPAPPPAAAAAP